MTNAQIKTSNNHGMNCLHLDALDRQLLDLYQKSFPLTSRPYHDIAMQLGVTEETVLERLEDLTRSGFISRVGPVFRTHGVGTSTLAAMQVPHESVAEIAALISNYREVNHNYEREHRFNLWFVITAADPEHLDAVIERMERETGRPVMRLPMLEDYHIDLGFKLQWN